VFGVGAVLFGIPTQALDLGGTLIISGTVAFVGGLILAGIGVAVGELTRIADALRMRPAVRPSRPVEATEPAPASQPAAPVSRIPLPPRPKAEPPPEVAAFEPRPAGPTPDQRIAALRVPPEVAAYAPRLPAARAPEPPARTDTSEPRPPQPRPASAPAEAAAPAARSFEPRVQRPQVNSTVEASAGAMERLGSASPRAERKPDLLAENVPLSPNGAAGPLRPSARPPADEDAPSPTEADELPSPETSDTKAPRLDFLFRSKPSRSRSPEPGFDVLWPRRSGREGEATRGEVDVKPTPLSVEAVLAEEARADEPPLPFESPPTAETDSESTRSFALVPAVRVQPATILKSGVVDGMPYTLYSDGSIEAQLQEGTVRFGSITELRAHIESSE
jgi:hypothetical protein